jgi:hypothetical protein
LLANEPDPTETSVILTTWHSDEPLDEVLHFFLTGCSPAMAYLDSARSALAVTIRAPELARQVRSALTDPREFLARLGAEGESDA